MGCDRFVAAALEDSFVVVKDEGGFASAVVDAPVLMERQAGILKDKLDRVARAHNDRVVVDVSKVETMPAACLTDLLGLQERCESAGGRVAVVGMTGPMLQLLDRLGCSHKLAVATTRAEAVGVMNSRAMKRTWWGGRKAA